MPEAIDAPDPSAPATPAKAERTVAARLSRQIETEILAGRYRPGERLDEASLAKRHGVSRTPVREALRHLAARGLVVIRPHQGAAVAQLSTAELIEMFEVMAVLEAACAGFAARRLVAADKASLLAFHEECRAATAADDPNAFYEANNRFHDALYRAAHNHLLETQTLSVRTRLEPYRRLVTFHPGRMSASVDEHQSILDRVFAMDAEGAAACARDHLDLLRDDITLVLRLPA
ncbi:MAG TPA: GntR family transcriptional regulator [Alphaproteobacteria bacterium]|nr:GntR family transcriptional regulator [Alphaproteobacteria bacterium]